MCKMPLINNLPKAPLQDQITELQVKIQLLEGDRTADYESSQATIKKNKDYITELRLDNKKMRKKLTEAKAGDEHVIKAAFQDRMEKNAYRSLPGKLAVARLEQKALAKKKRLNAQIYRTQSIQRRLDDLNADYERTKLEASSIGTPADAHTMRNEENAMTLRTLENNLEKTQFKAKEASKIMMYYQKLRHHLQDESLTFQGQLDQVEMDIVKQREELHTLQIMKNKAQLSREAAKAELHRQEQLLYREKKERERIIESYKKKASERKFLGDKIDRRAQRVVETDELSVDTSKSMVKLGSEEEKTNSAFEEAFKHIKDATGVTDVQEIVECFISQKDTNQNLKKLMAENEEILKQLKKEKEVLDQQYEEMKYSGETKLSSEQQLLDDQKQRLQAQQQKCDAGKERLDWLMKTLGTVRAGVEHLVEKLQNIAHGEEAIAELHPESDEYVLGLLQQCEGKLELLNKKLEGQDLKAIAKQMEEQEFYVWIEGKPLEYKKQTDDQNMDRFQDEEDSEEDEVDILSREALKRQSQFIIDSSSKKKPWKKPNKF